MQKYTLLLLLLLCSVACETEPAVPTPPVVTAIATETAVPTDLPPTATAVVQPATATQTVAAEPATPTAVPTSAPPTATPTSLPEQPVSQIQLQPVLNQWFQRPVYLTHANDGRLFVVEQHGLIHIVQDGQLAPQPFLDIRDRVGSNANEQGLLSVAFHPDYAENGLFYVNYTDSNGSTIIARFHVDAEEPNRADPSSEQRLLTIAQPYSNHNGGLIKFGPDGYLYIGMGDGGSQGDPEGHGQSKRTLLGALLRIDVNTADAPYGIPASNPFVGDDAARGEIWATGLRNPWRFSFDRQTGDLFIADVGQNQWEEVSFQPANSTGGENYGWHVMEGSHCYNPTNCDAAQFVRPIFEYEHAVGGCSITGGYVYRGQQFPQLVGNYFVADYCTGYIWRLFQQADGRWDAAVVLESGLTIASFGEDAQGELYVLDHGGGIYQIQP